IYRCGDIACSQSFPTRRSSDLKAVEVGKAGLWALEWLPASSRAKPDKRGGLLVVADKRRRLSVLTLDPSSDVADEIDRIDGRLRSEEHTSELQSRENLVCRLPL